MDGILIINKPSGCTSHDVVAKIRRILSIKKIGHTGTLDPDATGVLSVCIGKATKLAQYTSESEKEYRVVMKLGEVTDTQDATGRVIKETKEFNISEEELHEAFRKFTGKIKQIPPMYSAVKVGGIPLYKMARKGKEIPRTPREIHIKGIKLNEYSGRFVKFDVTCSKGTYVRTLCNDIGDYLGAGAHMYSLERLASGEFTINNSITLEELEGLKKSGEVESALINAEQITAWMPCVKIKSLWNDAVKSGRGIPAEGIEEIGGIFLKDSMVRIMSSEGELLSIASAIYNSDEIMESHGENVLKVERVLV